MSRRQAHLQRSNLAPSDKELRMALRSPRPKPFGIRRPFTKASQAPLLETILQLCNDEELPKYVKPREALYDTMLPLRRVDSQLTRGIIVGYKFAKQQREARDTIEKVCTDELVAVLGSAAVINSRTIGLVLISDDLSEEHLIVDTVMSEIGIHKPKKHVFPMHVSLGNAPHFISNYDQEHIKKVLDANMPIGEEVSLLPLEFYP